MREGATTVYRVVKVPDPCDEQLPDSFLSSRAKGDAPSRREKRVPELYDSISVYKAWVQAEDLWRGIAQKYPDPEIGSYIAELRLEGGEGFMLEDLGEDDGHMELWGDPLKLAARVVDIQPCRPVD